MCSVAQDSSSGFTVCPSQVVTVPSQLRQTSDALRQGRVVLRQGRWHADGTVTTCEGQALRSALRRWSPCHRHASAPGAAPRGPGAARRWSESFMQHEVSGLKQQLSSDQVALYRYRAEQLRQTSGVRLPRIQAQALRSALRRWSPCHRHASAPGAAPRGWLEAPEGSQLLLVANEDFCTWQPTEKSF
jgi:hypothetical protein